MLFSAMTQKDIEKLAESSPDPVALAVRVHDELLEELIREYSKRRVMVHAKRIVAQLRRKKIRPD